MRPGRPSHSRLIPWHALPWRALSTDDASAVLSSPDDQFIPLSLSEEGFSLPHMLPVELQLLVLEHLGLEERMVLRLVSKALRTLMSRPEGWSQLAWKMWADRQPTGTLQGCDNSAEGYFGQPQVVPEWLSSATLVDICARTVPWPSCLSIAGVFATAGVASAEAIMLHRNMWQAVGAEIELATGGLDTRMGLFVGTSMDLLAHVPRLLAVLIADAPFPQMVGADDTMGGGRPSAPLPFTTPAQALGVPRGWALRLTAYYELTLLSAAPSRGAFYLGLVDESVSTTVASLSRAPWEVGGQVETSSTVAGAFCGAARGGIFLCHTATPADGAANPAATSRDERVEVALTWCSMGRQQRRVLSEGLTSGNDGGGGSAAPPLRFQKGDGVGVCIDYSSATCFWTHNGARLGNASLPIPLTSEWRPAIGASATISIRANFGTRAGGLSRGDGLHVSGSGGGVRATGGHSRRPADSPWRRRVLARLAAAREAAIDGTAPFAFDVLQYEISIWHELHSTHSMKLLFEDTYGSAIPAARGSCAAFRPSPRPSQRVALAGADTQHPSGWPWAPEATWAHTVECHLEPWLAQQFQGPSRLLRGGAPHATTSNSDRGGGGWSGRFESLAAASAEGGGRVTTGSPPHGPVRLPARLRLFPSADGITPSTCDRSDLASFVHAYGLPAEVSDALTACGLRSEHLAQLPVDDVLAAVRSRGMSAGACLRLRRAMADRFGVALGPRALASHEEVQSDSASESVTLRRHRAFDAWCFSRRRVFCFLRPVCPPVSLCL